MLRNYKYAFIDAQYLTRRNLMIASKDPEYNKGTVVKMVIWSINKLFRDYGLKANKIILLWDKYPYFTSEILKGDYKDSREYKTYDDIKPEMTDKEKEEIEIQAKRNQIMQESKWFMISNLGNFGMPSVVRTGMEADYWNYIFGSLLYNDDMPSIGISKDSDWSYHCNPNYDFYRLGTKGSPPELYTYDSMTKDLPRIEGLSLYWYKAILDSSKGSHNDMRRTLREDVRKSDNEVVEMLFREDYSILEDVDRYKLQLSTFIVENYPDLDKILNTRYFLDKSGRIGTVDEFRKFADENGIDVSDSYYQKFISNLNPSLYEKSS